MSTARVHSPFFKVMGEQLAKMIGTAVHKRSFGVTEGIEVLELRGVTAGGESFVIDHIEARLGRKGAVKVRSIPAGKLRLAASEGETI